MENLSARGWTAFAIIYGGIFALTWVINILGPIPLFWKILNTIGGAIATYWLILMKNI